jgi:hypothetical protein
MTLISDLTIEATERDLEHGWQRESVKAIAELKNPELLKPHAHAYLSDTSVTIRDTKTRRVVGGGITNGELARRYLKRTMSEGAALGNPKLLRCVPYRKEAMQFMERRPAYHFAGQTGGPFTLVDIKACYATLYSRMTLDLVYRPETNPPLLGIGRAVFPQASEWLETKGPRNALWGTLLNQTGVEWRHGTRTENAYPNQFFAPDLRGLVYDAIHAIAQEAIHSFGALSWAVDGGCFRPEEGRAFAEWLADSFGLTAEIRAEGPGWLFGPTSYQVGPLVTLDAKKGQARQGVVADSLRPQGDYQRRWLADVFKGRS